MAIEKEESIACSCFGFRTPTKYLFKPGYSNVVARTLVGELLKKLGAFPGLCRT
jgi:hypothetical protein